MSEFTMGSLFSGIGGLDEGVRAALGGGDLRFVADVEKGPSRVLAARYPGVPNLGDITRVDWHEVEPVDVLCGGSPCFPAGTLVETEEGARPIEEVRVGDMVRTHLGRYQRVTAVGGYYADDVLELRIMGAPRFQVTPNHPFYVREEKKRRNPFTSKRWKSRFSDPKWVKAGDLCTTDTFRATHYVGVKLDDPDDTPVLGTAMARLIGSWLSTPAKRAVFSSAFRPATWSGSLGNWAPMLGPGSPSSTRNAVARTLLSAWTPSASQECCEGSRARRRSPTRCPRGSTGSLWRSRSRSGSGGAVGRARATACRRARIRAAVSCFPWHASQDPCSEGPQKWSKSRMRMAP